MTEVVSISQAAQQIGVSRHALSGLLAVMDSRTASHPSNGKAKGITREQFEALEQVTDFARHVGSKLTSR